MGSIIELALIFVPPAALICFVINLVRYIAARKKQIEAKKRMWIIPLAVILGLCFLNVIVSAYDWSRGVHVREYYENFLSYAVQMFSAIGSFNLILLFPYSLITYFILSLWKFIKASKAKSRKPIHIVNLIISSCMAAATVVMVIVFLEGLAHM
ncbi:MAG: hypothetical protein J1F11_04160 [Oscillospiraceae bacterium]|nr:hypothetical protein [Oscillospiraceae bacterium]